jgi:thiosulfate/3-mercaptopyruvate sulfurtransferase
MTRTLDKASTGDTRLRLIHVAETAAFFQAHIPGAILVDPRELVDGTPPASGRLPTLGRLEALFSRLGYHSDVEFVLCDDEGGGWAGRFAWTLDVIGHREWRYLNGGLAAWITAGGEIATGAGGEAPPTTVELRLDTSPVAELEDVLAAITDPQQIIWDVRSRAEFLGERSGSARAGHIPGAVHLDWMDLKDPARALRLIENLRQRLEDAGIDGNRRVITHCQTHHRSGLSYMVGRLLGFSDIQAYPGSWSEWGNRDDTPVSLEP